MRHLCCQGPNCVSNPVSCTRSNSPSRLTLESTPVTHNLRILGHIVRFRHVYGVSLTVFLLGVAVVSIVHFRPPRLNKPFLDFTTVSTDWSAKVQQFHALLAETSSVPWSINVSDAKESRVRMKRDIGSRTGPSSIGFELCAGELSSYDASRINLWDVYRRRGRLVVSLDSQPKLITITSDLKNVSTVDNFLTQFASFQSLCLLQQRINKLKAYQKECLYSNKPSSTTTECCPVLSLPNLIASLLGISSCNEVTRSQLKLVESLLLSCLSTFRSGQLSLSCWDIPDSDPALLCPLVQPVHCLKSPLIPLILATVLPDNEYAKINWRHTLLVLPVRQAAGLSLFNSLDAAYHSGNLMRGLPVPLFLHGMHLHAYEELISHTLNRDTLWLIISLGSLLILLAVGSCGLLLPSLTLLGIIWSLLVSFTVYTHVLRVPSFPVINFMAIVLAIGLGADDLLVYFQVWRASNFLVSNLQHFNSTANTQFEMAHGDILLHSQAPTSEPCHRSPSILIDKPTNSHMCDCQHPSDSIHLIHRLHMTLSHAFPSMTLTSVSTVLGLLVNLMSSIIAVQRFAIFAVLLVLFNFLFVLLTVPIMLLIFDSFCCKACTYRIYHISKSISAFILRTRFILPCMSFLTACVASYHLFHSHRFGAAQSSGKVSSFFSQNHPFEVFIDEQSHWFWAERNLHHYSNLIEVHFVWGFLPKDDRSLWTFDAEVHGHFPISWVPDHRLNLTSSSSRSWISDFCQNRLHQLPYLFHMTGAFSYKEMHSPLGIGQLKPYTASPVWCPIGRFPNSINNFVFVQACQSRSEHCCPYGRSLDILAASDAQFRSCLVEYVSYGLHTFPREYQSGYRFSRNATSLTPVALILTVLTNLSSTTNTHAELYRFTDKLAVWLKDALMDAPPELAGGLTVIPTSAAFEVTLNVTQYVHWGVISSVLLATLMVFVSTRNIWLSLLALLSLTSCLLVTVAVLVLFDQWTLGVVEGLVISLAAGLAIDPCIHLAVSVSSQTKSHTVSNRRLFSLWSLDSVLQSVTLLSGPVTGSALSTAVAGLSIISCHLLCYHQIGAFLATLMSFSWLFCYVSFASYLTFCSTIFRTNRSQL